MSTFVSYDCDKLKECYVCGKLHVCEFVEHSSPICFLCIRKYHASPEYMIVRSSRKIITDSLLINERCMRLCKRLKVKRHCNCIIL